MHIEACAPDGRYAAASSSWELDPFYEFKRSPRNGDNRYFFFPGKGSFELRVYKLDESDQRFPWYRYESFTGAIGGDPEHVLK
jgi:hypothetical protein